MSSGNKSNGSTPAQDAMSAAELSAILDISADAIVALDSDLNIILYNQGAEKMFGYSREEMLGKPLDLLLPESSRSAHAKHIHSFGESGPPAKRMGERENVAGLRRNGEQFPVDAAISRVQVNGGVVYTAILRDVTESVKSAKALQQARNQLEDRVAERTAELAAANQYLHDLSGRLLASQEEERRRIARELHDSTSQWIAAAMMTLGSFQESHPTLDETGKKIVADCVKHLEQASGELRTVSYRLHPPLLEELGLGSAVSWYVSGFSKRSGIHIDVSVDETLPRFSRDIELTLFRIVQEALTNVHRHSGADNAAVVLSQESGCVRVEVTDRGKGIAWDITTEMSPSLGVGVAGMRERVLQLGGAFAIRSDDNGTTVSASIPIATDAPPTAAETSA